jgi:sugar transferase (PEP-CTERM system associated)
MGIFLSVIIAHIILSGNLIGSSIELTDIVFRGLIIAFFAQFCMYILDLYDLNISFSILEILFSVVFTTGFVFVIIGVFSFVNPNLGIAGEIYYLTVLILFVFLLIWRYLLEIYIENYPVKRNVLILGSGDIAIEIAELIENSRRLGFSLIGFVNRERVGIASNPLATTDSWDFDEVKNVVKERKVNEIVVAPAERRKNIPVRELLELKIKGVRVLEWPDFYEKLTGKIPVSNLPPSYFVFNEGFDISMGKNILIRIFSLVFSLIALIGSIPLLLTVALLIKMDSKGSVFFLQDRVGKNGNIFKLIKFRTMVKDAECDTGPVWTQDDDPRITKIGKLLRKFRIDEIPQFINVLKGEMDVVGPRPERPQFVTILEKEIPYYSLRHSIKPGVTGWAQVKFSYGATIDESRKKLEYDLFYLKNKSFKLDSYILLKTVKITVLGRGSK